jgi:hypothetical protein
MNLNPLQRRQRAATQRRWMRRGLGVAGFGLVSGAMAAGWPAVAQLQSPFLIGLGAGGFAVVAGLAAVGLPHALGDFTRSAGRTRR